MRYKNIFLDLDGTITDSGNAIMTCAKYALDKMCCAYEPEEKLRRFVGPSLMDSFEHLYGMSEEQAAEATRIFRSLYVDNKMYDVTVYPGIPELLAKCRDAGLKTFVVTSKVQEYAGRIMEKVGLLDYFTGIIGPDPQDFSSDKSRLINRAVKDYSLEKSECVMVGDTRFDIEGAVKAGVDSIAVTYGYGNPAEMQMVHPTYKADNAEEIENILFL